MGIETVFEEVGTNKRAVQINSLNESVLLFSSSEKEDMEFLINKAYELLVKIKQKNGGN